jgi:hypothetical protein
VSDPTPSFGARYAVLAGIDERLALEAAEQRRGPFTTVDRLLTKMVSGALRGQPIAAFAQSPRKRDSTRVDLLMLLDHDDQRVLAEHFDVEKQEGRGSWHIPDSDALALGVMNIAHWARQKPHLALNLAESEKGRASFRDSPASVALWSLEPLFEALFLPLKLRGLDWLGKRTVEQQQTSWAVIDPLYGALGIDLAPVAQYRPATGWSRLSADEVLGRRQALVGSWATAADAAADRYRVYRLGQLIDRYYVKAKDGRALRRQVVTKAHNRTLTAFFGGGWLAFLDYLGEEPHPNEQVVHALPATKLMIGSSNRTAEVAAQHGLAVDDVEKMLAAFWQQSDHVSPIDRRVEVLKQFWTEFDELHTLQAPGRPSLWGLVQGHSYVMPRVVEANDKSPHDLHQRNRDNEPHHPRLFEQALSPLLNAEIAELWGTAILPRWPDRLVTEPAPHARMAEAFGPALRFWEAASLTAWFLCEGPYSRTSIEEMANYHSRELDALAGAGCPVSGDLFHELRDAEKRYGAPRAVNGLPAITISIDVSAKSIITTDSSRGGYGEGAPHVTYEQLRDIITHHRRMWAKEHLDRYIRSRWEKDLRATATAFHRHVAQKSKVPTLKQFAKMASADANEWFGGNLSGVYGALGLTAPQTPERADRLVPIDPDGFATRLYERLRGQPYKLPPTWNEDPEERERHNSYSSLASSCVDFLQLEEALGERPPLKTYGRQKFVYYGNVLADEPETAWELYSDAVHEVLAPQEVQRGSPAPPRLAAGPAPEASVD